MTKIVEKIMIKEENVPDMRNSRSRLKEASGSGKTITGHIHLTRTGVVMFKVRLDNSG